MSDNFNTNQPPASATSRISRSTTTRPSRFDHPRIVRVSRALGGRKDRHSKVCTVRGLRDRRVRLSVPTAIQLYDLQERLGLNQPSKVVDWLLDAAKHEVDELPPLHFPQDTAALGANLLNFQEPVSDSYLGISSKDDEVMISHEDCRDEEKYWARLSIQEQREFHDHHLENNYNNQSLLLNSTWYI
ncbi:hypothetical protein OROMI_029978 [Orobanche minor]